MHDTGRQSEEPPADLWHPPRVCPPDWDLTPTEYALLLKKSDSRWRGSRGRRAISALPDAETIDLSEAGTSARRAAATLAMAIPSRHEAARSLTAYAIREQLIGRLWLLATKITEAQRRGATLSEADLARYAPPATSRRRTPAWKGLWPELRIQLPTPTAPPNDSTDEPPGAEAGAPGSASLHARWTAALDRYELVMTEWGAIASDPLAALEHASLLDVTQPRTAVFIEALGRVQDRRAVLGTARPADVRDLVEFEDLARAAYTAWREAKRHAVHVGYSWLPEKERVHARRAERLLRTASDAGATLAERAVAAEQAAKLLRRIHAVVLPEAAMEVVAAAARLAIEAPARSPRDPRDPPRS